MNNPEVEPTVGPMRQDDPAQEDGPASLVQALRDAGPALASHVVEEVFQGVLQRSPGAQGAEIYPRRLRDEGVPLRECIAELIARPEFPRPVRRTEHFDSQRYLLDHPDVAQGGLDPLEHYVTFGRKEGRTAYDTSGVRLDPPGSSSDFFDGARYLQEHRDIAATGANPLDHYLEHGLREGRAAWGKNGHRIAAPFLPGAPPPTPVVHATVPPDLLQLVQDLITECMISEGVKIRLPPGRPPENIGLESQMRAMLLTLSMLGERGRSGPAVGEGARAGPSSL